MGNRRFTPLTNAFSKKAEDHCHILAVSFMNYKFCRKHSTIKTTPAQSTGISDHQWTLEEEIVTMDAFWQNGKVSSSSKVYTLEVQRPTKHAKSVHSAGSKNSMVS